MLENKSIELYGILSNDEDIILRLEDEKEELECEGKVTTKYIFSKEIEELLYEQNEDMKAVGGVINSLCGVPVEIINKDINNLYDIKICWEYI